MEEDIKVLEELCNSFKYQQSKLDELERDDYAELIQDIEIIAIENLIKGYKELEEENNLIDEQVIAMNVALLESMPKSIIKARIEKLKVLAEKADDKTLNACELDIRKNQIYLLQSLLQEGDK